MPLMMMMRVVGWRLATARERLKPWKRGNIAAVTSRSKGRAASACRAFSPLSTTVSSKLESDKESRTLWMAGLSYSTSRICFFIRSLPRHYIPIRGCAQPRRGRAAASTVSP